MIKYEKPISTVDFIIVTLKNGIPHVMLTKRKEEPFKDQFSLLGGFVFTDHDETLEDTVNRVLLKKIGTNKIYTEQLETIGSATRDPRGWSISISFVSLISWEVAETIQPKESISEIKWCPYEEIKELDLAFDHKKIIQNGMERLKTKINYSTLPIHLLPEYFTLTQLQEVYEIFLDTKLDKSGFRKKLKDIPLIETDKKSVGNHRPAKLYKLNTDLNFFRSNILI